MKDAYGRRRSSRSTPTGPGSRGGRWHDPEFRRDYQRAWRRAHPDYERERQPRKRLRRRQVVEERTGFSFGEVIRLMVRDEAASVGIRALARRLMVDHSAIARQIREGCPMTQEYIDAYVTYFGLRAVAGRYSAINGRRLS